MVQDTDSYTNYASHRFCKSEHGKVLAMLAGHRKVLDFNFKNFDEQPKQMDSANLLFDATYRS